MAWRIPYRLRQVATYSSTRDLPPDLPPDALERLTPPMLHQFRILPAADQRHLLRVYYQLRDVHAEDDTVTAGLIHDVGKACAKCRITLVDRGLHVILRCIAPRLYQRFASIEQAPEPLRGLHRLANHARRGALAASQAGYNDRVIELIRYHENGNVPYDPQLHLLQFADDRTERF